MNRFRPKVRRAACAAYIHDYMNRHTGATYEAALNHWLDMHPQHKVMRYRNAMPFVDAVAPLINAEDTTKLPVGTVLYSLGLRKVFIRVTTDIMTGEPYMAVRWVTVDTGHGSMQVPALIDADGPFELLHKPEAK